MTAEEKSWSELYLGVGDVLLRIFLEYMAVSQQYLLGSNKNLKKAVIILDCIPCFVQIKVFAIACDIHLNL